MIDQLASDTAILKSSEKERAEKLDSTLKDVDTVIADLKTANSRRESENRMLADQVRELKSLIPQALEGWKANGDVKLDELSQDMSSLKKLLENRIGRPGGASTPVGRGYAPSTANVNGTSKPDTGSHDRNYEASTPNAEALNDAQKAGVDSQKEDSASTRAAERKAAIPAWQRAAANKHTDENTLHTGSQGTS